MAYIKITIGKKGGYWREIFLPAKWSEKIKPPIAENDHDDFLKKLITTLSAKNSFKEVSEAGYYVDVTLGRRNEFSVKVSNISKPGNGVQTMGAIVERSDVYINTFPIHIEKTDSDPFKAVEVKSDKSEAEEEVKREAIRESELQKKLQEELLLKKEEEARQEEEERRLKAEEASQANIVEEKRRKELAETSRYNRIKDEILKIKERVVPNSIFNTADTKVVVIAFVDRMAKMLEPIMLQEDRLSEISPYGNFVVNPKFKENWVARFEAAVQATVAEQYDAARGRLKKIRVEYQAKVKRQDISPNDFREVFDAILLDYNKSENLRNRITSANGRLKKLLYQTSDFRRGEPNFRPPLNLSFNEKKPSGDALSIVEGLLLPEYGGTSSSEDLRVYKAFQIYFNKVYQNQRSQLELQTLKQSIKDLELEYKFVDRPTWENRLNNSKVTQVFDEMQQYKEKMREYETAIISFNDKIAAITEQENELKDIELTPLLKDRLMGGLTILPEIFVGNAKRRHDLLAAWKISFQKSLQSEQDLMGSSIDARQKREDIFAGIDEYHRNMNKVITTAQKVKAEEMENVLDKINEFKKYSDVATIFPIIEACYTRALAMQKALDSVTTKAVVNAHQEKIKELRERVAKKVNLIEQCKNNKQWATMVELNTMHHATMSALKVIEHSLESAIQSLESAIQLSSETIEALEKLDSSARKVTTAQQLPPKATSLFSSAKKKAKPDRNAPFRDQLEVFLKEIDSSISKIDQLLLGKTSDEDASTLANIRKYLTSNARVHVLRAYGMLEASNSKRSSQQVIKMLKSAVIDVCRRSEHQVKRVEWKMIEDTPLGKRQAHLYQSIEDAIYYRMKFFGKQVSRLGKANVAYHDPVTKEKVLLRVADGLADMASIMSDSELTITQKLEAMKKIGSERIEMKGVFGGKPRRTQAMEDFYQAIARLNVNEQSSVETVLLSIQLFTETYPCDQYSDKDKEKGQTFFEKKSSKPKSAKQPKAEVDQHEDKGALLGGMVKTIRGR